jgi:hypothetical protein
MNEPLIVSLLAAIHAHMPNGLPLARWSSNGTAGMVSNPTRAVVPGAAMTCSTKRAWSYAMAPVSISMLFVGSIASSHMAGSGAGLPSPH